MLSAQSRALSRVDPIDKTRTNSERRLVHYVGPHVSIYRDRDLICLSMSLSDPCQSERKFPGEILTLEAQYKAQPPQNSSADRSLLASKLHQSVPRVLEIRETSRCPCDDSYSTPRDRRTLLFGLLTLVKMSGTIAHG